MVREEYPVNDTEQSVNIRYFGHRDASGCDDCIYLSYAVGNETYSSPDKDGKYFQIDLKRAKEEKLDRMINSTGFDGYFKGDDLEDDALYSIKGVVKGNVCYYYSHEVRFGETPWRTVHRYDEKAGKVFVQRYPSYWRFMLLGWAMVIMIGPIIWDVWEAKKKIFPPKKCP
jgi:hypothetical protein